MKIEEMKLDSLERERARLENQLMDLRQRVDREREELKRVETLRLDDLFVAHKQSDILWTYSVMFSTYIV